MEGLGEGIALFFALPGIECLAEDVGVLFAPGSVGDFGDDGLYVLVLCVEAKEKIDGVEAITEITQVRQ